MSAASYAYRTSHSTGSGVYPDDTETHEYRHTNPRPDWSAVRAEILAHMAIGDGMVFNPRFRHDVPTPLPVEPPPVGWGWQWSAYLLDANGRECNLSVGAHAYEPVSLAKVYRQGIGGLWDYTPRMGMWPFLPAFGAVLVAMPPTNGEYGSEPWLAIPWSAETVTANADLPAWDEADTDEDYRMECDTHGDPAIGELRGPYDAGGGCDTEAYCPQCLTDVTSVWVTMDVRAFSWIWATWETDH